MNAGNHGGVTADTICAVATPPGVGGIGVVRISGPLVADIAATVAGRLPKPRMATLADFRDESGQVIDSGIALYFPGPASFTGEDVLELQGHGGPVVLHRLLDFTRRLGARDARPGEFSERAFLNGKIDLAQAEAIADLIESGTEAAAKAAQRSLQGVFSGEVEALRQELTSARVFVEAAIDFPDEEIDFLAESDVLERVQRLVERLDGILGQARQGRLLRDGIVLAIIGRPNAGKSSLLNRLSGEDTAIVTEVPGTTRDLLREQINLDGIPVHVIDTAGIRDTDDAIEAEGVRRARRALRSADIVLVLQDASSAEDDDALAAEIPDGVTSLRVANKADLDTSAYRKRIESGPARPDVWISAKTGQGVDELKTAIRDAVGAVEGAEGAYSARARHIDALLASRAHLETGRSCLVELQAGELLAEELRLAQQELGKITGQTLADDLLGEIFASFCIGK